VIGAGVVGIFSGAGDEANRYALYTRPATIIAAAA
jgi:hypothetical protein